MRTVIYDRWSISGLFIVSHILVKSTKAFLAPASHNTYQIPAKSVGVTTTTELSAKALLPVRLP